MQKKRSQSRKVSEPHWHGRFRYTQRGRIELFKTIIRENRILIGLDGDFSAEDVSSRDPDTAQIAIEELVQEGIVGRFTAPTAHD
jgi:hypothetical protein